MGNARNIAFWVVLLVLVMALFQLFSGNQTTMSSRTLSYSDFVQRANSGQVDRVTLDGEPVALTPTEYDILKLLMQNPGQVFSPREIYSKIWNDLPLGSENTVAVHIRHLREKLEINPAEPRYLKVVWGQGYKCEKQG